MINALALAVEVLDDPAANSDDVTAALTVIRNGVVELTLAVERLAAKPSKNSTFETPHS
jgi:hypothetical protein